MLIDKHIVKQKLLKNIANVNNISKDPLTKEELNILALNIAEQLAEVYKLISSSSDK